MKVGFRVAHSPGRGGTLQKRASQGAPRAALSSERGVCLPQLSLTLPEDVGPEKIPARPPSEQEGVPLATVWVPVAGGAAVCPSPPSGDTRTPRDEEHRTPHTSQHCPQPSRKFHRGARVRGAAGRAAWVGRAGPRPVAPVCPRGHSPAMWLEGDNLPQLPHLDTRTPHLRKCRVGKWW